MRLLLDTHVVLWWFEGAHRIRRPAREAIVRAEAVFVSAVSCVEASIKMAQGKLRLPGTFLEGVERSRFFPIPLLMEHGERLAELPRHHGDPFDRLLVAQALVEKLRLVTADRAFEGYDVDVLWA